MDGITIDSHTTGRVVYPSWEENCTSNRRRRDLNPTFVDHSKPGAFHAEQHCKSRRVGLETWCPKRRHITDPKSATRMALTGAKSYPSFLMCKYFLIRLQVWASDAGGSQLLRCMSRRGGYVFNAALVWKHLIQRLRGDGLESATSGSQ